MVSEARCGECGSQLEQPSSIDGLCPKCLVRLALDEGAQPEPTETFEEPGPESRAPEQAGPFRILRKLGEGGMGEVYLAEQVTPVRRRVALKLIKPGMDSRQVVTRFQSERQALALMEHPAIAKFIDAGVTDQGRWYFAMEYVEGEPVTVYCDRHKLDTRDRLELFMQICYGVQHAHQKGIIHRDLKPSNVLITIQDQDAVPKIIDFGVAKATQEPLTARTTLTAFGAMIGTPEYMSPEQAEMTGLDVDTRTDVYSLGVILYQLLAGTLPFDAKDLRGVGVEEIRRQIREDEPPKPSARVSSMGKAAAEMVKSLRTDLPTLQRALRGDLDWITMKALEKDRTRRYQTPLGLATDIKRHLSHEPVTAGPPSSLYRARKLVRRHRLAATAVSLVLVALLAGAILATVGMTRARRAERTAVREANTAHEVSEFLVHLFEVSDPGEARGNQVTARELLDEGAERVINELKRQPEVQAQLLHTIARVYRGLGLYRDAEPLARRALEARQTLLSRDDILTLESMQELGELLTQTDRYGEGADLLTEASEGFRNLLGLEDPRTLRAMAALAHNHYRLGEYDRAMSLYESTLASQLKVLGPDHAMTLKTAQELGLVQLRAGRLAEAASGLAKVLPQQRRALGAEHPDTLTTVTLLADVYTQQGCYELAEPLLAENLRIKTHVLSPEHPGALWSKWQLAVVHMFLGRLKSAEGLLRDVLGAGRRRLGPDHRQTLAAQHLLGYVLFLEGQLAEAQSLTEAVLAERRRVLGYTAMNTLDSANNLAEIYLAQGRADRAEALFLETLELRQREFGRTHPVVAETLYCLATLRRGHGEYDKALTLYEEAVRICEQQLAPSEWRYNMLLRDYASLLKELGQTQKAAHLLERSRVDCVEPPSLGNPLSPMPQG